MKEISSWFLPSAKARRWSRRQHTTVPSSSVAGLAAQAAGRPDLIRSPKRVLAHTWEGLVE
jgi:hypothetical protein